MKFTYFKADYQTTIEEVKKQYKQLIFKYHPDLAEKNGMSVEEATKATQTINAEFDYLKTHNYNIHETAEGSTYTDWSQDVPDDVTDRFAEIIEQLIKMEGVIIEICGKFVWLSGSTYDHKTEIKGLGFKWAGKKRMWYLAPKDWKKKSRRELTMGEIRDVYGSQVVGTGHRMALTA